MISGMNKTVYWAAGVLLIAGLAGCSAAESETPQTPIPVPAESSTPVPAEMSEAQRLGFADEEDWFLRSAQSSWQGTIPNDDELLAAGALVCSEVASGQEQSEIVAVEGESDEAMLNNQRVITFALMALCPPE